jgi:hypothetical protein
LTRQVTVSWAAAQGASGYTVLRSTSPGGPYTIIANPGAKAVSFTNSNLRTGATYYYVVQSRNASGSSSYSSEVSATAP